MDINESRIIHRASDVLNDLFESIRGDDGSIDKKDMVELLHVLAAQPAFVMGMVNGYDEGYLEALYGTAKEAMEAGAKLYRDPKVTIN